MKTSVLAAVAAAGVGLWWVGGRSATGTPAVHAPPPPATAPSAGAGGPRVSAASAVDAGRYLVRIGGCDDCHTPGFVMLDGKVPEAAWLTGSPVGFRGPWGTTYGSNLRLFVKGLSADDFVAQMRTRNSRPPMPWPSLHAMGDPDLRALHAYLTALGPAGGPAPDYVPPTEEPRTPYVNMLPVTPKGAAAAR